MRPYRHPRPPVAVSTVAAAETLLYQDSDGTTAAPSQNLSIPYCWVKVGMKLSQDVTLIHKWGPKVDTADADLVVINGSAGAGETVDHTAAYFQRAIQLQPGRNRISIVNGGTPPAAAFVAVELNSFPGVIQ